MTTPPLPFLSVADLSVEFRTRNGLVTALEEVSFDVAKGEVLGVVGESGSVGRQIEDVLLRHAQATRLNARPKAIEMLAKVKIVDPESRYWSYPFELSGGMCQRVMIAIALACNPRLLIADEPTTGLDVTTQKATMDLIAELTRERGMSVVLITHDLGMAATYCDRIVVMQRGRVVESAPVAELFGNPRHPYTRKLIAASPGPDSRLEDLTAVPEELEAEGGAKWTAPAAPPVDLGRHAAGPVIDRPLLEVIDLVKEYPRSDHDGGFRWPWVKADPAKAMFRAVDGISFTVERGESVGLVGESGCGKSTTSSMLTRLLDPTAGSIVFDGEDIGAIPADRFARMPQRTKIQMVFQDPTDSLNPRFTAAAAIADPLRRLKRMTGGAELRAKIEDLADRVGLPRSLLERFPHQLSGGQKARVGIARAIAVDPQLLILDEPTSALDVSVQAVVLQLLDRLRSELGMSYIFVSHDLNVVRLLCDRVIVMNRGRIVETGKADDVLRNPREDYTRSLVAAIPHFEPESSPSATRARSAT